MRFKERSKSKGNKKEKPGTVMIITAITNTNINWGNYRT